MNRDLLLERLQHVFRSAFDDPAIILTGETRIDELLLLVSMDMTQIIIGCEQEFNIRLRPCELNNGHTISQAIDQLTKRISMVTVIEAKVSPVISPNLVYA